MRIAYLIHHDPRQRFGGSEVYARALAQVAVEQGHDVLVVARGDGQGQALRQTTDDGIAYAILDQDALADPHARFRLCETYDNPRAYRAITELLAQWQPEHLHIHHLLMTSARVVDWATAHGIPVTATLHDYWAFCHRITWQLPDDRACPGPLGGLRCRGCGKEQYNQWPGRALQPAHALGFMRRNALLRRVYRQMKAVFVPSRFVLDAHRRHGFAAANLVHLPYGLPPAKRLTRERPHRPLAVGYTGRLAPEKGVETLIEAAKIGQGFAVTIYGEGEADYEQHLRRLAEGAPVTFAGGFDHNQLDRVLENIDVLAAPSRWRENLPLAVLEAAARGLPAVVSDIGGLAETVDLCGAKALPVDDAQAWANRLNNLSEDENRWLARQNEVNYRQSIKEDLEKHVIGGWGNEVHGCHPSIERRSDD